MSPDPALGDAGPDEERRAAEQAERFKGLFELLQGRYGLDFSRYKPGTIERRLGRRERLCCPPGISYWDYLREDPSELDRLYRDLLIGVTSFFRDPLLFDFLDSTVVPAIVQGARDREVRLWVPGCASGEEAYSLAMLFAEAQEREGFGSLRVFATDVHQDALRFAGTGLYSDDQTAGLAAQRRERFMQYEPGGWRVRPGLRRKIVFANHDVVRDQAFARIDLVSCRNLLIYLKPDGQRQALENFRFSLSPGGYLILGPSESLRDLEDDFIPVDRQWRVFMKPQALPEG